MAKRKSDQKETVTVTPEQTVSHHSEPIWQKYLNILQRFLGQYPNLLLYVFGALALVAGSWFLYKELIVKPKQLEAVSAMWQAEQQFGRDSFQLALNDPGGGFDGFLAIADKFSGTPAGNLAHYYAGVCYLHSGDADNALTQFDDFSADGDLLPGMKYGLMGDCYSEKEAFDKALECYEKAADASKNELVAIYYLKKLGMLHEHQGNKEKAVKAYERLRRDYANKESNDWAEIEKYIYRAGGGK